MSHTVCLPVGLSGIEIREYFEVHNCVLSCYRYPCMPISSRIRSASP